MSASRWSRSASTLIAALALSSSTAAAQALGPNLLNPFGWSTEPCYVTENDSELCLRSTAGSWDWDGDIENPGTAYPGAAGVAHQTFTTTVGGRYRLAFSAFIDGFQFGSGVLEVYWGDARVFSSWDQNAEAVALTLTATAPTTRLEFSHQLIGVCQSWTCEDWGTGADISGIRVQAITTPEPATFALVAGGLALVGVAARRRRTTTHA